MSSVGHQHPGQDDAAVCERGGELGRVQRAVRGEGGVRVLELARHNQGGLRPHLPPALRCGGHQLGCRHRVRTQELQRSCILDFATISYLMCFIIFDTELECGHHRSTHCNKCPFDTNGTFMGEKFCHGDCKWVGGELLYALTIKSSNIKSVC